MYAFGHGFQDVGETLFPMSVGYIYTIVPSQEIAFKLGASIREIGAINRVRGATIHCIGFGPDTAFLKTLASENGGEYRATFKRDPPAKKKQQTKKNKKGQ